MRLLNFSNAQNTLPDQLLSKRVILRRPRAEHFEQWAQLRADSADFLQPYEPEWTRDELSKSAFRQRLRRHESEIKSGRGMPWFVFLNSDDSTSAPSKDELLVGGLTLSNIKRGVSQTATLGYWMGERYAGQGYMSEAVKTVCTFAFNQQRLHRIEAATVLTNERSQHLLRTCGFFEEGKARSYLKIAGHWHDHTLFARLASDPTPNERKN